MRRRRICVSTGKRGGFGALIPVMRRIEASSDLELQVVVTDMHLSQTFGYTIEEVRRYVGIAEQVSLGQTGDSPRERAEALGRCLTGMAGALERLQPDLLLLLGDRSETLATTFAAIELGIPVAHIQAGDRSGGLDDLHRAAITKLCHLHLAQTPRQAERVLALGEEPWRIHVTGAPYVDRIVAKDYATPEEVVARFGLDLGQPIVLMLQHSNTYVPERAYGETRATCAAVTALGGQAILCYPCSDQGYAGVIAALEELRDTANTRIEKNIDARDFLGLMAVATVMVGNSSAAVIEAPYFNLPAVNVGDRQRARERGPNIIDAPADRAAILHALTRACEPQFRAWLADQARPFGDGRAGDRIVDVIRSVELGPRLFEKQTAPF